MGLFLLSFLFVCFCLKNPHAVEIIPTLSLSDLLHFSIIPSWFICIVANGKIHLFMGFPGGSVVKNLHANAGDLGSISGSGISPGEGNGNPLQYSCLGNPMGRGTWWAMVNGVARVRHDLVMTQQQSTSLYIHPISSLSIDLLMDI